MKPVLVTAIGLMACLAGAQPANDNFASANVLTGNSGTVSDNNTNATLEACETNQLTTPLLPGVPIPITNSVWYVWTAPATGTLFLNTYGSATNNAYFLSVWTSTNSAPTMCDGSLKTAATDIDSQSDTNSVFFSQVIVPVVAGSNYYFSVASYVDGTPGENVGLYTLNWNLYPTGQ